MKPIQGIITHAPSRCPYCSDNIVTVGAYDTILGALPKNEYRTKCNYPSVLELSEEIENNNEQNELCMWEDWQGCMFRTNNLQARE